MMRFMIIRECVFEGFRTEERRSSQRISESVLICTMDPPFYDLQTASSAPYHLPCANHGPRPTPDSLTPGQSSSPFNSHSTMIGLMGLRMRSPGGCIPSYLGRSGRRFGVGMRGRKRVGGVWRSLERRRLSRLGREGRGWRFGGEGGELGPAMCLFVSAGYLGG